ncbi:MAG: 16S rRNA (cytosine(1402)-N(4))-methyltransferase RsmH [Candidatus Nomurabacteria bacterium]|nr:16S rRNA (cytosine(1402)-N(4))-methyltransferase RsmH [Candidatus Nomurabacteria bacterium]
METVHKSVLLKETIDGLNIDSKVVSVVVDGTFGGGGHSIEILKNFPNVKIIGIDQDKSAWNKAQSKFKGFEKRITFVNGNFRDIKKIVEDLNIESVDGVLLDIGLSSDQLENAGRGFSFMKDEPLLMTMKEKPSKDDVTAKDIVNTWSEENIANIIYGYGEEKLSRRIAKGIVDSRQKKDINTTFELVEVIKNSVPAKYTKGKIHFATRTFQALRIAVNDELNTLEAGLQGGFEILKNAGRMSVISFHSLEDRIVKNFYKKKKEEKVAILINKKPIIAGEQELKENKRARSSKLRVLEKIIY